MSIMSISQASAPEVRQFRPAVESLSDRFLLSVTTVVVNIHHEASAVMHAAEDAETYQNSSYTVESNENGHVRIQFENLPENAMLWHSENDAWESQELSADEHVDLQVDRDSKVMLQIGEKAIDIDVAHPGKKHDIQTEETATHEAAHSDGHTSDHHAATDHAQESHEHAAGHDGKHKKHKKHEHPDAHAHEHIHVHADSHEHNHGHQHEHAHAHGHEHAHTHTHAHKHEHAHEHAHEFHDHATAPGHGAEGHGDDHETDDEEAMMEALAGMIRMESHDVAESDRGAAKGEGKGGADRAEAKAEGADIIRIPEHFTHASAKPAPRRAADHAGEGHGSQKTHGHHHKNVRRHHTEAPVRLQAIPEYQAGTRDEAPGVRLDGARHATALMLASVLVQRLRPRKGVRQRVV